MTRPAPGQERQVTSVDVPAQVGVGPSDVAPVSPATGFSPAAPEQPSPFDQPPHDVLPGQPALPGLELSAADRRAQRGQDANARLGRALLRVAGKVTGLTTASGKAVREAASYGAGWVVGAGAEATDSTRARGSSRARQATLFGTTLKAGAGTILEDRSSRKVEKFSRRVVKNARKLDERRTSEREHSRSSRTTSRRGQHMRSVRHAAAASYAGVKAGYSDWRVRRNAGKLAKHAPKLDRRSRAIDDRISTVATVEARSNRRREQVGLKPMSSIMDQQVVAERAARNTRVAEGRRAAEAVIARRRR